MIETRQYSKIPLYLKTSVFIYIFSLVFDYQDAPGASMYQTIMVSLCTFSGLISLFFLFFYNKKRIDSKLKGSSKLIWIYILSTLLLGIFQNIDWIEYIKIIFPILNLSICMTIFLGFQKRNYDYNKIFYWVFFASLISVFWQIFYGFVTFTSDIMRLRYQLIGPGIIFVFSYSLIEFSSSKKNFKKKFILLIFLLLIIGLIYYSVTRTYMFILITMILAYIYIYYRNKTGIFRIILIISTIFFLSFYIINRFSYFEIFSHRWLNRMFYQTSSSGVWTSGMSRIAKLSGELNELTQNIITLFFGKGFGNNFSSNLNLISLSELERPGFKRLITGPTDYTWLHYIYYNGIIFGSIPLVIFLRTFKYSLKCFKNVKELVHKKIYLITFLAFIGYMVNSIPANILNDRFLVVIIGVIISIIHIQYDNLMKNKKRDNSLW